MVEWGPIILFLFVSWKWEQIREKCGSTYPPFKRFLPLLYWLKKKKLDWWLIDWKHSLSKHEPLSRESIVDLKQKPIPNPGTIMKQRMLVIYSCLALLMGYKLKSLVCQACQHLWNLLPSLDPQRTVREWKSQTNSQRQNPPTCPIFFLCLCFFSAFIIAFLFACSYPNTNVVILVSGLIRRFINLCFQSFTEKKHQKPNIKIKAITQSASWVQSVPFEFYG